MKNYVLYAVAHDGERRPLYSAAAESAKGKPDAKTGIAPRIPAPSKSDVILHFGAAATAEIRRCGAAGLPSPSFVAVLEHREANPDMNVKGAALKYARFIEIDPGNLEPLVSGDKGTEELAAIFAAKGA